MYQSEHLCNPGAEYNTQCTHISGPIRCHVQLKDNLANKYTKMALQLIALTVCLCGLTNGILHGIALIYRLYTTDDLGLYKIRLHYQ